MLQSYPTTLTHVLLDDNDITSETKSAMRLALGESDSDLSSSEEEEEECVPHR